MMLNADVISPFNIYENNIIYTSSVQATKKWEVYTVIVAGRLPILFILITLTHQLQELVQVQQVQYQLQIFCHIQYVV